MPGFASSYAQLDESRIRSTSPSLYRVGDQERGELLGQSRSAVRCVNSSMAAVAQRTPVTAQWQPMVQAFGSWLEQQRRHRICARRRSRCAAAAGIPDESLVGISATCKANVLRYDPASGSFVAFTLVGDVERQSQRLAAAEQLIDFIARQYGIDVLPELLQGFAQYEDWEDLAPAVLGVSAC